MELYVTFLDVGSPYKSRLSSVYHSVLRSHYRFGHPYCSLRVGVFLERRRLLYIVPALPIIWDEDYPTMNGGIVAGLSCNFGLRTTLTHRSAGDLFG